MVNNLSKGAMSPFDVSILSAERTRPTKIPEITGIHIDTRSFCMLKDSVMKEKGTMTKWFWWQLS
jgi:hypothetical protein